MTALGFTTADRVFETSLTTGTGPFTLNGPVLGYQSFNNAYGLNSSFYFAIVGVDSNGVPNGSWEVCLGHLAAATSLVIDLVINSSAGRALVNWSGGTLNIYSTHPAMIQSSRGVGIHNLYSNTLQRWRTALANVRSASSRGVLVLMGDSTTTGVGCGTGGVIQTTGAFGHQWPSFLNVALNKIVPTNFSSFIGDQNLGQISQSVGDYTAYDTRMTYTNSGNGWNITTGSILGWTIGGNFFAYTSGGTGTMGFAPPGTFDTVSVSYAKVAGGGSFQVNVNGGAPLGTVSTANATTAFAATTFSFTSTANPTINIVPSNNGNIFFNGISLLLSTTPAIDIIQAATNGATAAVFGQTANAYSPVPALALLPQVAAYPTTTILSCTINDWVLGTNIATYQTQMQSLITALLAVGDVILFTGAPSSTGFAAIAAQQQYNAVNLLLALNNNIPLLNLTERFISYTNANGFMPYYNGEHPARPGHADMADFVAGALAPPIW